MLRAGDPPRCRHANIVKDFATPGSFVHESARAEYAMQVQETSVELSEGKQVTWEEQSPLRFRIPAPDAPGLQQELVLWVRLRVEEDNGYDVGGWVGGCCVTMQVQSGWLCRVLRVKGASPNVERLESARASRLLSRACPDQRV